MSSIMRGDQTVSLIQQYHAHYPEIARNTQDVEGRKQRVHMWAKITEDLNALYNTNFTVEQFKKKVQNVQCTSRQKIQSGKRNLGDAEMEYMRLFEQDRLNNAEMAAKINGFVSEDFSPLSNRSLNASSLVGDDFNANTFTSKHKFIDGSITNVKSEFVNNNNNDGEENHEEDEERSTPSTSAVNGFNINSANKSDNGNNQFNAIFKKTSGNSNSSLCSVLPNTNTKVVNNVSLQQQQLSGLDNAQHLLLAMMALSNNNGSSGNNGDGNFNNNYNGINLGESIINEAAVNTNCVLDSSTAKNLTDTLLATIKNATTFRKRPNSSSDNNNSAAHNDINNVQNNTSDDTAANNENFATTQGPPKRRRKQSHALHLSHLRPAEVLFDAPNGPISVESNAAVHNSNLNGNTVEGVCPSLSSLKNNIAADTITVGDHRWRSDVIEMQKSILENQRRILGIMERQTIIQQHEERELRAHRISSSQSPPSPPLNARQQSVGAAVLQRPDSVQSAVVNLEELSAGSRKSEAILSTLCEKIEMLSNALTSIDATIKGHFPLISAKTATMEGLVEENADDDKKNSTTPNTAGDYKNNHRVENDNNDISESCGIVKSENVERHAVTASLSCEGALSSSSQTDILHINTESDNHPDELSTTGITSEILLNE